MTRVAYDIECPHCGRPHRFWLGAEEALKFKPECLRCRKPFNLDGTKGEK